MAGRKKGLSADEKRIKMLELFYESKEFFQMKELEKIAPKQKGVISQSVKEITQLLVDEGLVECEKIGTFVCYWAFPTKAAQTRKRKLDDTNSKIAEFEQQLAGADEQLREARLGKEDCPERTNIFKALEKAKDEEEALRKQMKSLERFDPEALAETQRRIHQSLGDANRWTDNIFSIKKWCKKKFGMEEKLLDKQFEIPSDLDYVES